MGSTRRYHPSLIFVAAVLILCIGVLAGINLWVLRALHHQAVHTTAAESILNMGRKLAADLAHQPAVVSEAGRSENWNEFARVVQLLREIEPAICYVSVTEGGVILYHEQSEVSGTGTAAQVSTGINREAEVRLGRQLLGLGDSVLPVITFTVQARSRDGRPRYVQVAVRKDAVEQQEAAAAQALAVMFRLSLATILIALGVAVVLVMWMFNQEMTRQRRRRDEEHLAFAGALADGIIHDVRNPMSSLRLDVQMLQKEAERGAESRSVRLVELAERARRTMDRVDLVMREFLYMSKPEPAELERVEVNACVQDSLDLLGPRFERMGVHMRTNLLDDPLEIKGFGVALKRAMINVLTNAKQASPPGGKVYVRTWRAGGYAHVEVRDEGPGIPRSDLKRIFDMFVSGRPDGIGLGLSLAKTAIASCGGTIVADNAPEGGARFVIKLPLAEQGSSAPSGSSRTAAGQASDEGRTDG